MQKGSVGLDECLASLLRGEAWDADSLAAHDAEPLLSAAREHDIVALVSDRLASILSELMPAGAIGDMKDAVLIESARALKSWRLTPSGSEGYAKAEVTVGGVDTNALSQQTMEARAVRGLFFIGEAVDVTGWLGGYNFQWAWSSSWAAGQSC